MSMQTDSPTTAGVPKAVAAPETSAATTYRPRRLRKLAWDLIPVGVFAAIVALWAGAVEAFDIPSYLLPSPQETFARMANDFPLLWENTGVTLTEIVAGLGITIVTAIPLGLMIALSRVARQVVYPPVVFMQLVPKIAIAPLFVVWIGFGMESKILLTILMTFFPLLVASISGFRILDDRMLYLTKSMGASRWQTFRYLRFPSALPVIFSGLKTSATLAATAALVAEFVGANTGLGYLLLQGTSTLDTTLIFAVLVVLTIIGIALNYLVELVEWLLTPWQRARNN
ncbi:ABC transporter permease [Micromonospora sp. NBC_00617]|uniref:ABC transporter permease n=1 Tax=Micromonospora sp. NBC_00617 TaxID=2903587 RepID=UPI0030DFE8CD